MCNSDPLIRFRYESPGLDLGWACSKYLCKWFLAHSWSASRDTRTFLYLIKREKRRIWKQGQGNKISTRTLGQLQNDVAGLSNCPGCPSRKIRGKKARITFTASSLRPESRLSSCARDILTDRRRSTSMCACDGSWAIVFAHWRKSDLGHSASDGCVVWKMLACVRTALDCAAAGH